MSIKICENHYYDPSIVEKNWHESTWGEVFRDLFKHNQDYASCHFCRSGFSTIQQLPIRDRIGFWLRRNMNGIFVGSSLLSSYLLFTAFNKGEYTKDEKSQLAVYCLIGGVVSVSILTYFIAHKVANSIFKNHYVQI